MQPGFCLASFLLFSVAFPFPGLEDLTPISITFVVSLPQGSVDWKLNPSLL